MNHSTIEELGENEARKMTGVIKSQLFLLNNHHGISESLRDFESRWVFIDIECLLHYLVYTRLGVTKFQMSMYYFGGDPRRFSYSIGTLASHLYHIFYHKKSGNSMAQWLGQIDQFRSCIWKKITNGGTVEPAADGETLVTLQILLINFNSLLLFLTKQVSEPQFQASELVDVMVSLMISRKHSTSYIFCSGN